MEEITDSDKLRAQTILLLIGELARYESDMWIKEVDLTLGLFSQERWQMDNQLSVYQSYLVSLCY